MQHAMNARVNIYSVPFLVDGRHYWGKARMLSAFTTIICHKPYKVFFRDVTKPKNVAKEWSFTFTIY